MWWFVAISHFSTSRLKHKKKIQPECMNNPNLTDTVVWSCFRNAEDLIFELANAIRTPFFGDSIQLYENKTQVSRKNNLTDNEATKQFVFAALSTLCISSSFLQGQVSNPKVVCSDKQKLNKEITRKRLNSMLKPRDNFPYLLPPQTQENTGKITVVLDLDETLAFARYGPVYPRPGIVELMSLIGDKFEAVVWTASSRLYAREVINTLDPYGAVRHLIYRHESWFGKNNNSKDLKLLGRDLKWTIIIDNTPDCIVRNPDHGVLLEDYSKKNPLDTGLFQICRLLTELANSGLEVPTYLRQSNLVRIVGYRSNLTMECTQLFKI